MALNLSMIAYTLKSRTKETINIDITDQLENFSLRHKIFIFPQGYQQEDIALLLDHVDYTFFIILITTFNWKTAF